MFQLLRPYQWSKNLLVFAGVLFSQVHSLALWRAAGLTFLAFSFMASSAYVLNDWFDREADRHHPKKRHRPLASGHINGPVAAGLGISMFVGALALSLWVDRLVAVFVVSYALLNVAYSLWLKHQALLDVFAIASGFMLRLLAGTVGLAITPSNWLLLCGLMATLFLGFAKRRAELIAAERANSHSHEYPVEKPTTRRVLIHYSAALLDKYLGITASATIISYGLYTVDPNTVALHGTTALIYSLPAVIYGIFRYLYLLHRHQVGEDPSRELFRDPHVLISTLVWLGIVWAAIR